MTITKASVPEVAGSGTPAVSLILDSAGTPGNGVYTTYDAVMTAAVAYTGRVHILIKDPTVIVATGTYGDVGHISIEGQITIDTPGPTQIRYTGDAQHSNFFTSVKSVYLVADSTATVPPFVDPDTGSLATYVVMEDVVALGTAAGGTVPLISWDTAGNSTPSAPFLYILMRGTDNGLLAGGVPVIRLFSGATAYINLEAENASFTNEVVQADAGSNYNVKLGIAFRSSLFVENTFSAVDPGATFKITAATNNNITDYTIAGTATTFLPQVTYGYNTSANVNHTLDFSKIQIIAGNTLRIRRSPFSTTETQSISTVTLASGTFSGGGASRILAGYGIYTLELTNSGIYRLVANDGSLENNPDGPRQVFKRFQTTDATVQTIHTHAMTTADRLCRVTGRITAVRDTAKSTANAYAIDGVIANQGGTVTANVNVGIIYEADPDWDAYVEVSGTNVLFRVMGEAVTVIDWQFDGEIELIEF